jgi:glycosyltransferase involved in cell wall biosynthesis
MSRRPPNTGVIFRGPIFGGSGYGDIGVGALTALHEAGIAVQTLPMGDQEDTRKLLPHDTRAILEQMRHNRLDLSRSIFCQSCSGADIDIQMRGRVQVAHSMFETDRLPLGWAERYRAMDEVWFPARFFGEVLARAGVDETKMRVMGRGLDANLYQPGAEPLPIPHSRGFNFLSVFDWHYRKGPDLLLRAYLSEFQADEDVALVLKVYQINNSSLDLEAEIAAFIECEMGLTLDKTPPIILLNGFLPNSEMPRLYAAADAFVLPTRGEGWGPFMEPMACECPVIATRWSGQLDYLTDDNSFLVDIDGVVPVSERNDMEVFAGHCWASPSVDHLRSRMRQVFSNREEAKRRARQGREDVVSRYAWPVAARRWTEQIERLLN